MYRWLVRSRPNRLERMALSGVLKIDFARACAARMSPEKFSFTNKLAFFDCV
jgi:hypothetical protein